MSDVLRWMCDTYRTKLQQVNPTACHEIDLIMERAGQQWILDNTIADPDELVTSQDMEDRYGISKPAIQFLARKYAIPVRGRLGKFNIYRLGDILAVRAKK